MEISLENRDKIIKMLNEQVCPICEKTGFKAIMIHIAKKHNIPKNQIADILLFSRSLGFCTEDLHESRVEHGKEVNEVFPVRDVYKYKILSDEETELRNKKFALSIDYDHISEMIKQDWENLTEQDRKQRVLRFTSPEARKKLYRTKKENYLAQVKNCIVEGCDKISETKGMCKVHYTRYRERGTTDKMIRHTGCAVEGCENKHFSKGYCKIHYHKIRWENKKKLESGSN